MSNTITFEFETIGDCAYRLIIRDSKELLDVMERRDYRDPRTAKIALFSFVHPRRLDFDNVNIDRFLFCE